MVLVGIIIPFLMFFISINTTYAFFTATTTEKHSSTETAIVRITFNEVQANAISTASQSSSTTIMPGDTLTVAGQLVNSGTADCYVAIVYEIKITKIDGSTETPFKKYYTYKSGVLTEITGTEGNYSTTAGILKEKDGEDSVTLNLPTYEFAGATYNNDYKNATVTYFLKGSAIQTVNIPGGASEATDILMGNLNKS